MAVYKDLVFGNLGLGGNFTGIGTAGGASSQVLLKKVEASSDATISFTNDLLNSNFKEYIFTFISMHPATDNVFLSFNCSTDNGSNYNVTHTTTFIRANNNEADSSQNFAYMDGSDAAQQTSFQVLEDGNSNDNDHGSSGYLHLFNPSSSTFQKLFYSRINTTSAGDFTLDNHVGGTFNTASAIDAIQFKFSSGNIDAGTIKMHGVN